MINNASNFHGSDLEKIESIYGIKKSEIHNFGSNVNPLGLSQTLKDALAKQLDVLSAYPDRDYIKLRQSISNYCGADLSNIVVGNGSTELISLYIKVRAPKKTLILSPSYSEYERELNLSGGTFEYFPLDADRNFSLNEDLLLSLLQNGFDLFVLCNPNNPTSTALSADQIRRVLDFCLERDIDVMIDETYAEFAVDTKLISAVPLTKDYENLIVLRGTSKFFAAPGLRLGYAITSNSALLASINTYKNPWSVNALAETAGILMFADSEYISRSKDFIISERTRIQDKLKSFPYIKVFEPAANFILIRILPEFFPSPFNASSLFEFCITRKLMIRNCAGFEFLDDSYFRFCIMDKGANELLLGALGEYFGV